MIRSRLGALALSVLLLGQPTLASAQMAGDCASQVQSAENQARTQYINGMSGLAQNNFSQRQQSYTQLACLDKFMQGNMDTLFRPPQLSGLLSQVLNFACQQAKSSLQSAMGNTLNLQSLIGSMSGGGINIQGLIGSLSGGGLNLSSMASLASGGGIVNLGSSLAGGTSTSASSLQQLLPVNGGSYSSGGISIGSSSTSSGSTDPSLGSQPFGDTSQYKATMPSFSCSTTTGTCQTCDPNSGACTPSAQYMNCDQNGCVITDPSSGTQTQTLCDPTNGFCVPAAGSY